jgi:hypothetical protein
MGIEQQHQRPVDWAKPWPYLGRGAHRVFRPPAWLDHHGDRRLVAHRRPALAIVRWPRFAADLAVSTRRAERPGGRRRLKHRASEPISPLETGLPNAKSPGCKDARSACSSTLRLGVSASLHSTIVTASSAFHLPLGDQLYRPTREHVCSEAGRGIAAASAHAPHTGRLGPRMCKHPCALACPWSTSRLAQPRAHAAARLRPHHALQGPTCASLCVQGHAAVLPQCCTRASLVRSVPRACRPGNGPSLRPLGFVHHLVRAVGFLSLPAACSRPAPQLDGRRASGAMPGPSAHGRSSMVIGT